MPFCPYCGSATVPDGQFCPNCGRRLPIRTEKADPGDGGAPDQPPVETGLAAPQYSSDRPASTPEGFAAAPSEAVPDEVPEPTASRSSLPPEFTPPVVDVPLSATVNPADLPGTHPDWKMSPAEPYVPGRQRPQWLLIVGAVLGACLLLCVAVMVFFNTPPGKQFLAGQETQAARATTVAPGAGASATPVP